MVWIRISSSASIIPYRTPSGEGGGVWWGVGGGGAEGGGRGGGVGGGWVGGGGGGVGLLHHIFCLFRLHWTMIGTSLRH